MAPRSGAPRSGAPRSGAPRSGAPRSGPDSPPEVVTSFGWAPDGGDFVRGNLQIRTGVRSRVPVVVQSTGAARLRRQVRNEVFGTS
ncbi:MAG: hypothetical protein EHM78_22220 [Myxococcaceae bacterium]|nr:MAG: hypothetical protein EHM78_22220 [Myxococcaceae bacterium]